MHLWVNFSRESSPRVKAKTDILNNIKEKKQTLNKDEDDKKTYFNDLLSIDKP